MSPRQKADEITRYIRERYNLSPGDFIVLRITAELEELGIGIFSAKQWSKRVCTRLSESLDVEDTFA
jgi:bifunctional DNA-binding transcriptional regulator/antitoxin component of YhaV-PrlF toxin-antitoxin module